ncbi:uncharacterized protein [Diadema antillarum]|uniref:uncharacterized protein n=1 Tax=Diadema antillarum TaxID=105358 RepID=UPI003A859709
MEGGEMHVVRMRVGNWTTKEVEDTKSVVHWSALREELYEDLEPEHHALIFARTTHFLAQVVEETPITPQQADRDDEGSSVPRASTSVGFGQPAAHPPAQNVTEDYTQGEPSTSGLPPTQPVGKRKKKTENGGHLSAAAHKRSASETLPRVDEPLPLYNVSRVSHRHNKKYNANCTDYSVSFEPVAQNGPIIDMMPRVSGMFDEIVNDMVAGANDRDFIRVVFNAPRLDKPVSMPFVRRDQLDNDAFSARLQSVLQSHEEVTLDENVSFNIIHMQMPEGGKNSKRFLRVNEKLLKMRSIIRIKDRGADNMCCARAIVTGIARIENDENWNSIRQSYGKQGEYAKSLHREASVPYVKCGIDEIKQFENTARMRNYRVILISKENLNTIIYAGPDDRQHAIYLYHHDDHYDLVTSLSAFYRRSYFCEKCLKGYDVKFDHKCENACKLCRSTSCPSPAKTDQYQHCYDCNRNFKK